MMRQLNNWRRSLRNLGPLSMMGSKLEVARFAPDNLMQFLFELKVMGCSTHRLYIVAFMQQGFCFGFVEFESLSSMQSALEVLLTLNTSMLLQLVLLQDPQLV